MNATLFVDAKKTFCDYCSQLPRDTAAKTAQSFLYSFGIVTVLTGNLPLGVMAGTISAVCALVHAFTGPLFAKIFNEDSKNNTLQWYAELARTVVAFSAGVTVAHAFGLHFGILGALIIKVYANTIHGHFNPKEGMNSFFKNIISGFDLNEARRFVII